MSKPNYIIHQGIKLDDLCKSVSDSIKDGYWPIGSLIIEQRKDGRTYFYREMVLKEAK